MLLHIAALTRCVHPTLRLPRSRTLPRLIQAGMWWLLTAACISPVPAQTLEWQVGSLGSTASFRGLSIVDAQTLWASGSMGKVVRSEDHGRTWQDCGPVGRGELDYRCIHAFSRHTACVASAGTPAVLLRTEDGGQTWAETYRHESPQAFFDALVFWNEREGLAVSDPVDGRWLLVRTSDGGKTWQEWDKSLSPVAANGEAAFAASNGSLAVVDANTWWLGTRGATGEPQAALLGWNAQEARWRRVSLPLPSTASAGAFALDFSQHPLAVVVGGDYQQETRTESTAAWSDDGGVTWHATAKPPSGYRSSVTYGKPRQGPGRFVAVGPNGTDISLDGKSWQAAGSTGFHAIRSAPDGALYAVGAGGRIGRMD